MNHEVAASRMPIRALLAGSATGAVALGVPTTAYALSVDGVVRHATSNPLIMFGVGCAVGAVCGGLATGIVGHARRKRLEKNVDDALKAASHADELARQVQDELNELEGTMSFERQPAPQSEPVVPVVVTPREVAPEVDVPRASAAELRKRIADIPMIEEPMPAQQARNVQQPKTVRRPTIARQPETDQQSAVTADLGSSARRRSVRGVRSMLHQRLGTTSFNEPLVIDRGAERDARPNDFVNPHTTANLGLNVRSSAINDRLPRFDESLFPDTIAEQQTHEEDDFELAMRAMERSMPAPVVEEPVERVVAPLPVKPQRTQRSFGEGDTFDATSYVDYLLQDEIDRKQTPVYGRVRPHLTVFEGTGDLGAARNSLRRRPKHLARATREA